MQNVFHAVSRLLHVVSFVAFSVLEGGSVIMHCPCKWLTDEGETF
jgi:hypothetical protein